MIRRELAKDPKLAEESWDRFLPRKSRSLLSLLDLRVHPRLIWIPWGDMG